MKLLVLIYITISLLSCSKHEITKRKQILLLKVDYTTYTFEGGQEIMVTSSISHSNKLPLTTIYESPMDFGSLKITHEPEKETIFYGTIIWSGTGEIIFPDSFISSKEFSTQSNHSNPNQFQNLLPDYQIPTNTVNKVWEAVSNLDIVSTYTRGNKHIGIFIYTPSVGIGDPKEWDYFLVLSK